MKDIEVIIIEGLGVLPTADDTGGSEDLPFPVSALISYTNTNKR